jgi:C4-dicarboxylate-specific signal transduction histidine kinase
MSNKNKEIIQQRIQHSFNQWQAHVDASDIVQSVNDAQQALEAAQSIGDLYLEAEAYYLMGQSHYLLNNYDMTLKLTQKALRLHESIGCKKYLAEDWNLLGAVYVKMSEINKAADCYTQAIQMNSKSPRPFINLAQILTTKQQYLESIRIIRKAEKTARANGINHNRAISEITLAKNFQSAGKFTIAQRHLDKAAAYAEDGSVELFFVVQLRIANLLNAKGEFDNSITVLTEILPKAEKHFNKEHLVTLYDIMSDAYKGLGKYQQALEYRERYIELYNKIVHDDMRDKISKLQTMFELENEQLKAKQLAERASKFASIAVMAAGITHEINQPLSAIKVTADSMVLWHEANPYTIPKRFDSRMQSISDAVERIHEIVQHMRAFWTDTSEVEPTAVNPYDVIQTTVGLFQKQMLAHLITLDVAIHKETPAIRINRLHLEQICINLISNSIDALDSVHKRDKRICITLTHTQESVCLQIRDNATGIPDFLEPNQLFDPFYSTKTEGKGMGLGLAIVKSFVQKYQGTITATNNAEGGLTFDITFPRYKEIQ